ncbi:amino acid permease [Mycobacterium marinum]|uniref:amino acid permease n=1 Tax=Mycobacterium marinum TaxID=1781 RepID=UPI00035884F3|nr:amino acid permease [Mycobacterium marinum]EPQ71397.1 L-asparagine permease [Mycobacterium marinum MB2]MDC8971451.1 amino acid permease [Mycobacterium marinum]MDC8981009.1 amino acid permease [Mycobacterium marinum]MDC8993722.1 amino acid permease [Mycobacterium marinum]MDC8999319.1 amino acid permease [Mycobacterium marinum]
MPPLDTAATARLTREDRGYHKSLKNRQLQMIALGGAIGTGLFLGAGGRLASAGPGLFLVYGICGFFVFLILRALGELVLHRPSSGSFVSYAREFFGEKVAFVAGWMYFLNWAMTGVVDTTAIAHYCHYWKALQFVPQWTLALVALVSVLLMNLISVKLFGELEFWAALIKVIALVIFLIIGSIFLAGGFHVDGQETGLGLWRSHGGFLPTGLVPLVLVTSGVVFAYAAIELVGTAAGEAAEPEKIMPRAINSVVFRIGLFYIGSTVLLALLLPYTAYREHVSPFVTFFSKVGIEGAGSVMNIVVLTAALSSLNAGLYSTGRILRSMAINGSGPKFTAPMSKNGVPYGGILLTAGIGMLGIVLNAVKPSQAFEIVLHIAATGVIAAWATIVACQLRFHRLTISGVLQRPSFRMPLSPYSGWITLAFLASVLILMLFDETYGRWMLAAILVGVPALVGGWYLVRNRVKVAARDTLEPAQPESGHTGLPM